MSNKCQPQVSSPQPSPPERSDDGIPVENNHLSEAEAYNRAFYHSGPLGQFLLIMLVAFLSLLMFAFALEGITSQFNMIAASSFGMHSEIGAISTASELINGI